MQGEADIISTDSTEDEEDTEDDIRTVLSTSLAAVSQKHLLLWPLLTLSTLLIDVFTGRLAMLISVETVQVKESARLLDGSIANLVVADLPYVFTIGESIGARL